MEQELEKRPSIIFFANGEYILGSPNSLTCSERTVDIPFHDLAKSYEVQEAIGLLSRVFIKPSSQLVKPLYGQKLIEGVASFISAFSENEQEMEVNRDYLINNGTVRIIVTDKKLKNKLADLVNSINQTKEERLA